MTGTLAPVADRLGKLIRLLTSDRDGEVVAAARAIQRSLQAAGLDVHALAEQLEKPPAVFNEAEARKFYDAGYERGYQAASTANERAGFHNVSSPLPSWHETARWSPPGVYQRASGGSGSSLTPLPQLGFRFFVRQK